MPGEAEAWSDRGSRGVGRRREAQPSEALLRTPSFVALALRRSWVRIPFGPLPEETFA